MNGSKDSHIEHRQQIVAYIRQHQTHFEPFVEDDISFPEHLRRLSEAGTFGGNECIVAFARLHNVIVVIHQLNSKLWTIRGNECEDKSVPAPNSEVHISYHNGDHYNSVRRIGDFSYSPANVTLILNSNKDNTKDSSSIRGRHEKIQLTMRLMQYTGKFKYRRRSKYSALLFEELHSKYFHLPQDVTT